MSSKPTKIPTFAPRPSPPPPVHNRPPHSAMTTRRHRRRSPARSPSRRPVSCRGLECLCLHSCCLSADTRGTHTSPHTSCHTPSCHRCHSFTARLCLLRPAPETIHSTPGYSPATAGSSLQDSPAVMTSPPSCCPSGSPSESGRRSARVSC